MNESYSDSYAAAGVDITAGYRAVELMKAHVARTMTAGMAEKLDIFFAADKLSGSEYAELTELLSKE